MIKDKLIAGAVIALPFLILIGTGLALHRKEKKNNDSMEKHGLNVDDLWERALWKRAQIEEFRVNKSNPYDW